MSSCQVSRRVKKSIKMTNRQDTTTTIKGLHVQFVGHYYIGWESKISDGSNEDTDSPEELPDSEEQLDSDSDLFDDDKIRSNTACSLLLLIIASSICNGYSF